MIRYPLVLLLFVPGLAACGSGAPTAEGRSERVIAGHEAQFDQVTEVYGPLVVYEGRTEAEANEKPWSGWWYPVRDTYLFQGRSGQLAPLEKYDAFARANGIQSSAATYEREKLHDPNANGWEGLCDAWAAAALLEREPVKPVTINGITFGVGDLKALAVKTYEEISGARQFGKRFNGDRFGVYDDIYPDQFHRFLQAELVEKRQPFIMDKDPGVPVWNTPVWKAEFQIKKDRDDPQLFHVQTWLQGASPFVPSYEYTGTLQVSFEYTYDLYGYSTPEGGLRVVYGVWTGSSLDFHPDFVATLPQRDARRSQNTEINTDLVDRLLSLSRL